MSLVFFTDRDLGKRFPEILHDAGFRVERHATHFAHDTPDEKWLAVIGRKKWVALSHNERIRYTPNELEAVRRHDVRLVIVRGSVPYPLLAESFVRTRVDIEAFLAGRKAPFIAKVHRATASELGRDPVARGRIEPWWP